MPNVIRSKKLLSTAWALVVLLAPTVGFPATYGSGPIFGPFTDAGGRIHYYQSYNIGLQNGEVYSWEQARDFATTVSMSIQGCAVPGHLAAIESAEENSWIGAHASLGGYLGAKGISGQLAWVVGPTPGTTVDYFGRSTVTGGLVNNYVGACAHGQQVLSTANGFDVWVIQPDTGMKTAGGSEYCMQFKLAVEYELAVGGTGGDCPTPARAQSWGTLKLHYR